MITSDFTVYASIMVLAFVEPCLEDHIDDE